MLEVEVTSSSTRDLGVCVVNLLCQVGRFLSSQSWWQVFPKWDEMQCVTSHVRVDDAAGFSGRPVRSFSKGQDWQHEVTSWKENPTCLARVTREGSRDVVHNEKPKTLWAHRCIDFFFCRDCTSIGNGCDPWNVLNAPCWRLGFEMGSQYFRVEVSAAARDGNWRKWPWPSVWMVGLVFVAWKVWATPHHLKPATEVTHVLFNTRSVFFTTTLTSS